MEFIDKLTLIQNQLRQKRLERSRLISGEAEPPLNKNQPDHLAHVLMQIDIEIRDLESEVVKLGGLPLQ